MCELYFSHNSVGDEGAQAVNMVANNARQISLMFNACGYTIFFVVPSAVQIYRLSGLPTLEHATYKALLIPRHVFEPFCVCFSRSLMPVVLDADPLFLVDSFQPLSACFFVCFARSLMSVLPRFDLQLLVALLNSTRNSIPVDPINTHSYQTL
jgi:hypothetical protein